MKQLRVAGGIVGALGLLCLVGCSVGTTNREGVDQGQTAGGSVENRYQSGPLGVTVKVSPTTVDTAGQVVLEIRSVLKPGWILKEPTIDAELGKFSVVGRQTNTSTPAGGNDSESVSTYKLDPFLPGKYEIPALKIDASNGSRTTQITTASVPVTVTSLIPKGAKAPLELKSLAGPVAVPSMFPEIFAGSVTLLAVLAATVLFIVIRLRRKRKEKVESVPPWVRATRELDRLVSLDLPGKGRHREFYDSISMLVRRYIEEMFELNAPELTTEEFLYQLRDSASLGRHRRFLGEFLSHCDMVKFAAYLPAQDEIHRAVRSCRAFIDSTSRDYSDRAESEST